MKKYTGFWCFLFCHYRYLSAFYSLGTGFQGNASSGFETLYQGGKLPAEEFHSWGLEAFEAGGIAVGYRFKYTGTFYFKTDFPFVGGAEVAVLIHEFYIHEGDVATIGL